MTTIKKAGRKRRDPRLIPNPDAEARRQERRVRLRFNDRAKRIYLGLFERTAQRALAAHGAGVSLDTLAHHRKTDPAFAEAEAEALERFRDRLEAEAERRAVQGVEEPIYQRGVLVGTRTNYSDQLLLALLKRHRKKEYSDRGELDVNLKGGVLITPGAAPSGDAWAAAHGGAQLGPGKDEEG